MQARTVLRMMLASATASIVALALPAGPASAKASRVEAVEVELVADRDAVVAGQPITLGLRIRHDPKWHTYWRNPGDSGLPTLFPLELPTGYFAGPVQWPAPHRIAVGPLMNFGYDGDLILPVSVQVPTTLAAGEQRFATTAQWLMCKDVCIPGEAQLSLSLPVVTKNAKPSAWSSLFETMAARSPRALLPTSAALLGGNRLLLELPSASGAGAAQFFPYAEGVIRNASAQPVYSVSDGGTAVELIEIALADENDRSKLDAAGFFSKPSGVLLRDGQVLELQATAVELPASWASVASRRAALANNQSQAEVGPGNSPVIYAANQTGAGTLGLALLFAALGGLILNLMPCVFPIIGLKVLGFIGHPSADAGPNNSARALRHALAFAGGVLLCFWVVAAALLLLRGAGQALGWGFQLQSPLFVVAMALLFLGIGLNFSGVFEFGTGVTRLAEHDRGSQQLIGSFGSGCLAVLVATPCTAPFMGSAMGFAMTQSPLSTLAIFTAMALGMAAPYVLLGAWPAWTRYLPKPGAWMQTVRQLLAFPMYATVIWLAWVLALQTGVDSLLSFGFAAVCLALAAWLYGSFVQSARTRSTVAWAALLVAVLAMLWLGQRAAEPANLATSEALPIASKASNLAWQPWSDTLVAQTLAQGKPVFVDFTAGWCVTCQVNKKLVLERDAVTAQMSRRGVLTLRADWTQRNAQISAALTRLGRNGVPVYALYVPGEAQPRLLPEILTRAIVIDAIQALPTTR